MYKLGWSQDHPNLQKCVCVCVCVFIYIYIYIYKRKKKELYTKLTNFDHPNKNVEHLALRNTRI